jgi:hypothetical protein
VGSLAPAIMGGTVTKIMGPASMAVWIVGRRIPARGILPAPLVTNPDKELMATTLIINLLSTSIRTNKPNPVHHQQINLYQARTYQLKIKKKQSYKTMNHLKK